MSLPSPQPPLEPRGPSRRARVAQALDALGLIDRFLWLRGRLGLPLLTVLTYHRVARRDEVGELDMGVAEVEPEDFVQQLDMLKEHCSVVSMDQVRRHRAGRPLPKNAVMLAFDDGYLDNHDVALPILRRARVPATFFIPTAFPDAGKLFWWDRISLTMRRCQATSIELTYPKPLRLFPRRDPDRATRQVCKIIKHVPGLDLGRALEELERASGVHIGQAEERALASRTIMGWSKIKALRAAGMSVESHSHAHRVLGTLTPEEATRDLRLSRSILSDALGEQVHAVAYPVGYELTGPFRRVAHDAGFELAFTNATGLCTPKSDLWNLPRLSMDRLHVGALYKMRLLFGDRHHGASAA